MFVTTSMSEMGVGIPHGAVGGLGQAVAKPEAVLESHEILSSPASPVSSTNGDSNVSNLSATPMPLVPQMIFNSTNTSVGAQQSNNPAASQPPNSQKSKSLGLSPPPPGFRTDPGAPPGCFEHSLNILGGRYLMLDQLEGSHLQRCIDVNTKQEFVCKVRIKISVRCSFFYQEMWWAECLMEEFF